MLVYATTLWLDPTADQQRILTVIANWLAKKTSTPTTADWLIRTGEPKMRDGSRLSVIATDAASPELWAMRYSHADAEVSGRQWVTEVGLRRSQSGDAVECSIVVQTSEISARVTTPVNASRPTVVRDIDVAGLLVGPTPGRQLMTLADDADTVEAFLYGIEDVGRRHPYVLISVDQDGKHLVEPERVRSLLVGLADVVVIPRTADTFLLARLLGRQYAAWRGAVNVIFRKVQFAERAFVETRRLRSEDISELTANGVFPESEILSIVTHRTNLPLSWSAISLQRVHETVLRNELALRLREAKSKGDQREYIQLLEQSDIEQSKQVADLKARIEDVEQDLSRQQDVERRLRYELDRAAESNSLAPDALSPDEHARDSLIAMLEGRETPEQVLLAMSTLFPDTLVILPAAWKSVKRSEGFNEPRRAFELLRKLATDYWLDMSSGKGDTEAGKTFGKAYAARESETVEANPQARKRRTFLYDGQSIQMMRHLKIGVKDSVAETMRIHFHWDSTGKKVVIGHCGPHLDFD